MDISNFISKTDSKLNFQYIYNQHQFDDFYLKKMLISDIPQNTNIEIQTDFIEIKQNESSKLFINEKKEDILNTFQQQYTPLTEKIREFTIKKKTIKKFTEEIIEEIPIIEESSKDLINYQNNLLSNENIEDKEIITTNNFPEKIKEELINTEILKNEDKFTFTNFQNIKKEKKKIDTNFQLSSNSNNNDILKKIEEIKKISKKEQFKCNFNTKFSKIEIKNGINFLNK